MSGNFLKTTGCECKGHNGSVYCVAVISSTKLVTGSKDGVVKIWDVTSGDCAIVCRVAVDKAEYFIS